MAVVLEGEDFRVLTQYDFPSLADFDLYVREHAPTLRADGAKRFPAGRGVSFERSQGTVALSVGEGR